MAGDSYSIRLLFLLLALMASSSSAFSVKSTRTSPCGYDSCPRGVPGKINVHVVPHSHDDVGWLKTVDQYYYGSATVYQKAGVQYILDSVIKELQKDPARRFIYVEMAFFSKWWEEQSAETQDVVRQLVNEGRLEFINGGWCMNDEATAHYNDIVDQMTWGLRFLNDTFGECGRPRIAWQIDPFGHSREQANIFAQMGYDGVFFARLDREDKAKRLNNKQMEMVWEASNTLGEQGSIFTGALYSHYSAPSGFCFDVKCNDQPFIDNPKSPDYNVHSKIAQLSDWIRRQNASYASNHIMFTMGDDFNYMTADMNFKNMDKMIKYANQLDEGVNLFYSTPSCYVKALNEAGLTWPRKEDDFFPYSSDPHAYWTGYFTSRSAFKGMVRKTNTFLQSCKQLHSLANGVDSMATDGEQERIDSLRRSMGEAQHHDAVTGTEKEHVNRDYRLRLDQGTTECQEDVSQSFRKLFKMNENSLTELPEQQFCPLLNVSQCAVTERNGRFVVTAYNPLSHVQTTYVRLPVQDGVYTVLDPYGSELVTQLLPLPPFSTMEPSFTASERAESTATHELLFQASHLPPLGHKSYYVNRMATKSHGTEEQATRVIHPKAGDDEISITNQLTTVTFDSTTGLMTSMTVDGVTVPMSQSLLWYRGMRQGRTGNGENDRPSGAYVFRPNGTDAFLISPTANIVVYKGPLVEEVHQQFADWATQIYRVRRGHSDVEIEWTVGPIPVDDGIPKEIISRVVLTDGVNAAGRFYTDSNGRQTLLRQRNHRPTWDLTVTEPVSGNYYPINSHIYMTDSEDEMMVALLNDRSQGGTSLHDGQLELMVHRRLLDDDHFGVGEALNEQEDGNLPNGPGLTVRGIHRLLVTPSLNGRHPMSLIRPLAQQLFMAPWLSFSPTDQTFSQWKHNFRMEKPGLSAALPSNVHILTLEPWRDGTHLLRLEHVYDDGEHPTLAQDIAINLDDLLADYTVTWAQETTLGANQWTDDASRFQWTTDEQRRSSTSFAVKDVVSSDGKMSVTLRPMEIRTFIVLLSAKN